MVSHVRSLIIPGEGKKKIKQKSELVCSHSGRTLTSTELLERQKLDFHTAMQSVTYKDRRVGKAECCDSLHILYDHMSTMS